MFKKIYEFFNEKIEGENNDVFPIILSVVITSLILIDNTYFHNYLLILLWTFTLIVFIIAIWYISLKASFTVLRAFFFLSAELSLMIFLAQSYCGTPNRIADNELKIFVGVSIFYICYEFFKKLKEALKVRLDSVPKKTEGRDKIIVITMFLFFLIIFINVIYRIISPIILDLCIYK